jgi:hypothetical protein
VNLVICSDSPRRCADVLRFCFRIWINCCAARRWTSASATAASRGGPCRAARPLVRLSACLCSAPSPSVLCSWATAWFAWSGRVERFERCLRSSMLCGSGTCILCVC